jgi:hypothetical protein
MTRDKSRRLTRAQVEAVAKAAAARPAAAHAPSEPHTVISAILHAIRAWDAGVGEEPLCGRPCAATLYGELTDLHEYVTCPDCRAHPEFDAARDEEPWPLPQTVAELTAQLRVRAERRAAGGP